MLHDHQTGDSFEIIEDRCGSDLVNTLISSYSGSDLYKKKVEFDRKNGKKKIKSDSKTMKLSDSRFSLSSSRIRMNKRNSRLLAQ